MNGSRAHRWGPAASTATRTLAGVQDTWSLVVAGLLGLFTGVVAMLAFRASEREQLRAPEIEPPAIGADAAAVLEALRQIAVVVGPSDEIVRANPAAYVFGLVRAGRLVHRRTAALVTQVRRDGAVHETELELPRGPGDRPGLNVLRVRAAALPGGRTLVLADDETAARRLEEIRRDFVANVSHELKTPVGAISLLAETVLDAADEPAAVRRFALKMQREAKRLAQLVQEIIDLSRLQGPNPLVEIRPVSVDDVVEEAADRARVEAEGRQVSLVVGGRRGLHVMGDEALLVTAVRNLVDNAVRYSDPGTRVGIGVAARDGFVEIAVVDEGIGIAPEDQARIFERFYRVDPARSRETGGTGLGLSIVKHVAADHGGEVTVWSTLGRGSTFTIRLPEADVPAEDQTEGGPA